MEVSQKILEEIKKYHKINNYITEQEAELPPPPGDTTAEPGVEVPAGETTPPATPETPSTPVDVEADPEVEKIGGEEDSSTEELDITDLVDAQKNIEQKQDDYFNNLFTQLQSLESKLGEMNAVLDKLNSIENKIEKYRPKTAQEKLELRSLDSYPFNQKLSDFFDEKEGDLEKTGKNEYVLTTDEVEDFSPSEIKGTFNNFNDEDLGLNTIK